MNKSIASGLKKYLIDIVVIAILALVVFALPSFDFGFDSSSVLNVVSLSFAILIGFYFAAAMSNYLRLQAIISAEDAKLVSIHDMAKLIQPAAAPLVADAVDAYVIADLDYENLDSASHIREEMLAVIRAVDQVQPKDEFGFSLLQVLHQTKLSLYESSQERAVIEKRTISRNHWVIVSLLAMLIFALMLEMRTSDLGSLVVIVIVMFIVIKTLLLIDAVDSNQFLAQHLSFKTVQHVFESIGKPRYFPETALRLPSVPKPSKPYRVGVYRRAGSFEKDIKLVE